MKRGMERSPSPRGKYFDRMPDRAPRKYEDSSRDSSNRSNFPYRNDGGGRGGHQFNSSRPYRNERPDRPSWNDEKTERTTDFKTLFVGNLNQQVPDPQLKEALYKEFEKFGEFNVKLSYNGEEKVAYVCFRRPEDAKEAKRARTRAMLFDRPIYIDYATVSINARRRSASPDPHRKPRGRSPIPSGNRGPADYKKSEYAARPPPFDPAADEDRPQEHVKPPSKNKDGRFPDFLTHIDPEEDPDATRTLFVGNIDSSVTEEELRHMFKKHGIVEDIDMKRHGQGNPYAFVRFHDLDMAHEAKINLSGKYIGKFQLKIGFGKVHASNMVWIGGLSSSVTEKDLTREFARFGTIKDMDMRKGTGQTFILYDDMDSAKEACNKMRGSIIGGHRVRIDFNDPSKFGRNDPVASPSGGCDRPPPSDYPQDLDDRNGAPYRPERGGHRGGDSRSGYDRGGERRDYDDRARGPDRGYRGGYEGRDAGPRDGAGATSFSPRRRRSASVGRSDVKRRYPSEDDGRGGAKRDRRDAGPGRSAPEDHNNGLGAPSSGAIPPNVPSDVTTLDALVKYLPNLSDGGLILKSSAFLVRLHLLMGDETLVQNSLAAIEGGRDRPKLLRITQRLRLDQNKLDDMSAKIYGSTATGNAVLLALPDPNVVVDDPSVNAKRPLRNLMTYLKQKEAAGVIQTSTTGGSQCVLHAFPACAFAHAFLKKVAPGLGPEPLKDEHLVIVLMRGPST
jgi:RNA-binding protein 15